MDAREFFHKVVVPNYTEFIRSPNDVRLLWNVLVSMNTVPEYLALDRLRYSPVSRKVLDAEVQKIREELSGLEDLQSCANAFKHIRRTKDHRGGFTTVATSTGVSPDDQGTWKIGGYDLVMVVRNAFATFKGIQELE